LKKRSKNFCAAVDDRMGKNFSVLFFKKELLS